MVYHGDLEVADPLLEGIRPAPRDPGGDVAPVVAVAEPVHVGSRVLERVRHHVEPCVHGHVEWLYP